MLLRTVLEPRQVVILDEPLTSLDPESREKVCKLLKEELVGRTVILVSHDEELIQQCDQVVRLESPTPCPSSS